VIFSEIVRTYDLTLKLTLCSFNVCGFLAKHNIFITLRRRTYGAIYYTFFIVVLYTIYFYYRSIPIII